MQLVTEGLQFPEGPVAMADGSVILVEIRRGTLTRVLPDGRHEIIADLGGGPNGASIQWFGRRGLAGPAGRTGDPPRLLSHCVPGRPKHSCGPLGGGGSQPPGVNMHGVMLSGAA